MFGVSAHARDVDDLLVGCVGDQFAFRLFELGAQLFDTLFEELPRIGGGFETTLQIAGDKGLGDGVDHGLGQSRIRAVVADRDKARVQRGGDPQVLAELVDRLALKLRGFRRTGDRTRLPGRRAAVFLSVKRVGCKAEARHHPFRERTALQQAVLRLIEFLRAVEIFGRQNTLDVDHLRRFTVDLNGRAGAIDRRRQQRDDDAENEEQGD